MRDDVRRDDTVRDGRRMQEHCPVGAWINRTRIRNLKMCFDAKKTNPMQARQTQTCNLMNGRLSSWTLIFLNSMKEFDLHLCFSLTVAPWFAPFLVSHFCCCPINHHGYRQRQNESATH
jgi:hypothetical protein